MSNYTFQMAKGLKGFIVADGTASGSGYRRIEARSDGWYDIDNAPTVKRLAYADEIGTSFWERTSTTVSLVNTGDDVLLNTNEQIQFRAITQYIASDAVGDLLINVATGGELTIGINSVDQFIFDATAFYPAIAGMDLGIASSNEWVDGYFSGNVFGGTAPTADAHLTTKSYVDGLFQGGLVDWQDSVLDIATAPAGGETGGERYIVIATATGAFAGEENNIAEYNGTGWDFTTVSEGMAAYVEDVDRVYVYSDGSWVVMASIFEHNNLDSIQGGTTDEYYHLTSAEYTALGDLPTLTNNYFWMGNGSAVATEVIMSGDMLMTNTGDATIQANAVEGSMLNDNVISGQTEFTGTLLSTDELMFSDGGVLKRMDLSVLDTYLDGSLSYGDMDNPMTTLGDIIYASNTATPATPARLAAGTDGYYLMSNGAGTAPSWEELAPGKWTDTANATDIYRNSKISIGHTANPSAQVHIVENAKYLYLGHDGTQADIDAEDKLTISVGGTEELSVDTNSVEIPLTSEFVFGPDATDGSWRMYVSSGELVVEKYVTSAWVESNRFSV